MIYKKIVPCAEDFGGQNPVQILKISSKGLDKTASMQKRASHFQDVIKQIKPMDKKAYLHVITTGGYETYSSNRNNDGFNQDYMILRPPMPKNASCVQIQLDGGLKKYHDTYLKNAAVYQEHQVADDKKSGIIKAAKYNQNMHRGQLLIEVDTDLWQQRLNKRASGQDIYLSIGSSVPFDICSACGNKAHTLKQHCDHITKQAGWLLNDGTKVCMLNDAPKFYDISGVNVPADQMAFALRKIASGANASQAIAQAHSQVMTRPSMGSSKAAHILSKLAKMQKQLLCKVDDDAIFEDDQQAVKDFMKAVENYDADQVVDQCNRKAILLSPKMLFKLMGKEAQDGGMFNMLADSCPVCGKNMMQDMQNDSQFSSMLSNGCFDSKLPTDLNLANILQSFIPDFGVSRPALNGKAIRITIRMGGTPPVQEKQEKFKQDVQSLDKEPQKEEKNKEQKTQKQDIQKKASAISDQFRRTYARYVISFAQRNSQDTCQLALQKLARYR